MDRRTTDRRESVQHKDDHPVAEVKPDSEKMISVLANSSAFKVVQFFVLSFLIPLILWFGNSMLSEQKEIKAQLNFFQVTGALVELRLKALEEYKKDATLRGQANIERDTRIDEQLKQLRSDLLKR